ncbi:MAG: hypothetical protein Q4F35_08090 [Akkermansia sp.]|nr:hypothetical protein [Akkermansia sp.]
MRNSVFLISLLAAVAGVSTAAVEYPGTAPGKAVAGPGYTLSNDLLSAEFEWKDGGVSFGGLKDAQGRTLVSGGQAVFSIKLADGREMSSRDMKASEPVVTDLVGDEKSLTISKQLPGKAISSTFVAPDGSFSVEWQAVLRDGSHYLRQEYTLKAAEQPVPFHTITALQVIPTAEGGVPSISGNTTNGTLVVTDKLFMGLETPMSVMSVGQHGGDRGEAWSPESWTPAMFGSVFAVPESFRPVYGSAYDAKHGPVVRDLLVAEGPVNFLEPGDLEVDFEYERGNHRLNIVAVQLVTTAGQVICEDVHAGYTGHKSENAEYHLLVPVAGTYHLRYWVEKKSEPVTSSGRISLSLAMGNAEEQEEAVPSDLVRGNWVRKTELLPGTPWKVNSVMGLFAPGQQRRSLLAYLEREKPVPYRTMVHYNDWYEIGITRHDFSDPLKRTTEKISLDVLNTWKRELFEKRGVKIDVYMIDDGWDDFNSLWGFHVGFPNGFAEINKVAMSMDCGIGTWLGPVGGYGRSKTMRIAYWNATHPNNRISSFELSNPIYFNAFVERCKYMVENYDMRYFKFDGISTKFHAKGPGALEDAEGIINVLAELRKARPDIYLNTTVGTWASPFWFLHADSVWRQENDFDQMGNMGDARDRWITYRDRLVHEVFVQGSPLMPINAIMTHGTIITHNGPPRVMSKEPANCVKEMRTAFTSGSGLQEVYADAVILNQNNGQLWDELANCIAWIRRNADVLADTHWVGGNPWDKKKKDGDIYGWASWNKSKCTLSLRNSSKYEKTLKSTLREILDVPPTMKGKVTLRSSFADQTKLPIMDRAIDVDEPIEISLAPFDVVAMEGTCDMH